MDTIKVVATKCKLCKKEIRFDDIKITRSRGDTSQTYHSMCHFKLFHEFKDD